MKFGLRKRQRGSDAFVVFRGPSARMPADVQMNMLQVPMHMCSGFPTGRSEQTIMMSFYDVMRISYAIAGREL